MEDRYGVWLKRRPGLSWVERRYAQYLVDMMNSVDLEVEKAMTDLRNGGFREIVKKVLSQ